MTTDDPTAAQPTDETPLAGLPAADGSPDVPTPPPDPAFRPSADPAAFAAVEWRVAEPLARALTGVHAAIAAIVDSAFAPLNRAANSTGRVIEKRFKAADGHLSDAVVTLSGAGVPVSFSAAERAAELSDPNLKGVEDRVTQVIYPAAADPDGPADPPAEGLAAPAAGWTPAPTTSGIYGCGPGNVWGDPAYQYPRPGPLPDGKVATTCAKWVPAFAIGRGWYWSYDAFGWPGGELNWPPSGPEPPYPASEHAPPYVTLCYGDTCAAVPPSPPPPPPPPPPGCDDGVWDVIDSGGGPVLYAPGGTGLTPVRPDQSIIVTGSDGKCYWAGLPTVPDPLPPGVSVVQDDAIPAGCIAIMGVSDACPPAPPPKPKPPPPPTEPTPVPPSCPVPPPPSPPPPPIVIPACPKPDDPEPPPHAPGGAGAGAAAGRPGVAMDDPDACARMGRNAAAGRRADPEATVTPNGAPVYTPGITPAGWTIISQTVALLPAVAAIEVFSQPFAALILDQTVGAGLLDASWARRPQAAVPNPDQAGWIGSLLGMAREAENRTGIPITYLYQSDQYYFQWLNPQYIPSQSEHDTAWLTGRITDAEWECATRENGNLPARFAPVRDAKVPLPTPDQLVQLYRRGIIPNIADAVATARLAGDKTGQLFSTAYRLSEYVPSESEIVRFMVRDVFDPAVVARYGYDDGFATKFSGKAMEWATANGISRDVMAASWYSHWTIPSNTALYEMFHRLRPDRGALREWDGYAATEGAAEATRILGPRPAVVTRGEIEDAMRVNDIAPGWVGPLLDVSYRTITNTDARRAYTIGFFSKQQLEESMLDNGYSPADARTLANFFEAEREKSVTASTGVGSPRQILSAYMDGMIDWNTTDTQLKEYFPDVIQRRNQIRKADVQADVKTRRAIAKTAVKRFEYGEIGDAGLRAELTRAGLDQGGANRVVARAVASRDGHLKEPRSREVVDWYVSGMITYQQAYDRLQRLGYATDDTERMLVRGSAKEQERLMVKAAAEANRRRLEAKRNAKDTLEFLRKQQKEYEDKIKEAKKELERLIKEAEAAGCKPSGTPAE